MFFRKKVNWNVLAAIVGNVFEHFDQALFGLMAPFIAPFFFKNLPPVSALIFTYAMSCLGLISRPLGAFVFGIIGDCFGRKKALFATLSGMALVTLSMSFLPTYEQLGLLSPLLLGIARFCQGFFAAGETAGGAIFVLEHSKRNHKTFLSSIYDCSSILGILAASLCIFLFTQIGEIEKLWRFIFLLGGISGLCAIWVRRYAEESMISKAQKFSESIREHFHQIKEHRYLFLPIILVSGFGYTLYHNAFTLLNGFLPYVSTITKNEAIRLNSLLLFFDLLLLPIFGLLATRFTKEKMMTLSIYCTLFLAVPLFALLQGSGVKEMIPIRFLFVILGVSFSSSYYYWAEERVPKHLRYTMISLGTALGSQLIGTPSVAFSLWAYQKTEVVIAPAFYLMATAGLALWGMKLSEKKTSTIFDIAKKSN